MTLPVVLVSATAIHPATAREDWSGYVVAPRNSVAGAHAAKGTFTAAAGAEAIEPAGAARSAADIDGGESGTRHGLPE